MTKSLLLFCIFISSLMAATPQKVSVQLLWKNQFEFAGFYMAKKKGFYDKANLDVEIKEYNFGTNITQDVENGVSTFGVGYPNILLDKSKGVNITLLNALFQTSPHILIVLEKSGIKKIEDFKNKTIMIEDDAIKNAPLLSMLHAHRISLSDVKLIAPSFNIDDLISGKVDVFSAYKSNELYKLDELGIKYRVFDPKDYGFDFYNDLLFTSTALAQNNPELVSRFQRATLKGWEYAFSHIEETLQVIQSDYNTQNKSYKVLLYEAKVLKTLAYPKGVEFGNIDFTKLKRIQDIYGLMGLMQNDIDFNEFIFNSKKIYLSMKEKEFLKNTQIQVSVSEDWRPFTFELSGKPSGIASEYWELLAKSLGMNLNYKFSSKFTEQIEDIKAKKVDLIFSAGKTKDREKFALFTKKFLSFPISIATSKNEEFIEDFSKVLDKKIAVGKNFTAHKLLQEKYPHFQFVLVDSVKDGLEMVNRGEVYGFAGLKPVLSYQIKKLGYEDIKISGNSGVVFDMAIMIRDDYPLLQSALNKAIDSVEEEKVNTILKQYENIEFGKDTDYKVLYQILIVIAIVLLLGGFRQYILNRTNKKLKFLVDEKTKKLQELNDTLEVRIEKAIEENKHKDIILFQQSKMASMGEMIGNIAHQWRQPLSVISTSATGMHVKLEYGIEVPNQEILESFDRINETAQFLSKTIDDFQNYLKPQEQKELFNIKDVITKNFACQRFSCCGFFYFFFFSIFNTL